ncbi:CDP-archaeol synthase [Candidatus Falkowbacteria bacterium]|nr:CDP-archaeol synthase [Candidatus Falkowbacteria bacterium]
MLVLQALYFFLPAYMAHATPTVVRFLLSKKGLAHTTTSWSVVLGVAIAVLTTLVQRGLSFIPWFAGVSIIEYTVVHALTLGITFGVGIMLADLLVIIYKRKKGIIASIPLLEQIVYVAGGILSLYLVSPVAHIVTDVTFYHLILIVMFTPLIHTVLTIVAYITRLKVLPN